MKVDLAERSTTKNWDGIAGWATKAKEQKQQQGRVLEAEELRH